MLNRTFLRVLVASAVLALGGQASAQVSPTSPPHPSMPWNFYNPNRYGQVVREIPVPAQQVTIEVAVPTAEGEPKKTQPQVVQIPGYVVTETEFGFWIPEHYTLQQVGAGLYQWVKVPAEFRRK